MHQGYELLVWPSPMLRRSVWKGTLGWNDYTVPNAIKLSEYAFLGTSYWNPLEGHGELPMTLDSGFTQGWRHLNWWITGKFNLRILTRWGYRKWRIIEYLYHQLRAQTTVKLSSVLKARTKFPVAIVIAEAS